MDVTPLPGHTGPEVFDALHTAHRNLDNARGGHDTASRVTGYIQWAAEATRQLRHVVGPEDLERLVLTPGYRTILTLPRDSDSVTNAVLDTEMALRLGELDATADRLHACIERWTCSGVLVVLDTGVYLNAEKIEDLDFAQIVETRESPIRLLVPIVVVDELDRLKQSRETHIRWRAGYSLSFLDRTLQGSDLTGLIRKEDFTALSHGEIPRGKITGEVVLDPVGHLRLPIADDEIVDRAVTIQRIAARDVHLVTYDTGLTMRARAAGLKVHKLSQQKDPSDPRGPA